MLRVGLVGGGMRKDKAARLVALHFIPAYYVEGAGIASDAISAALVGEPDDPPDPKAGEPDGEANLAAPSNGREIFQLLRGRRGDGLHARSGARHEPV